MSLFVRIFLFFWLTAALLASSFFLLGRLSGSEVIEQAKLVLKAQADIVAALWQQDGGHATRHWLSQQSTENRPLLLDSQAQSPFTTPLTRHKNGHHNKLAIPLKAGIHRDKIGNTILVAELPGIEPPLFLVRQLEPMQMQRLPVWSWFLVSLLIISLLSFVLARVLSQRIRHLRHAVQGIAEGDFTTRVTLDGQDEVSALATDFNRMADRINDVLSSQRQLVSDVSHELRSPLARLRIALELAQRSDDATSALLRIEKEADELEILVTELLSLARIESGQFQLEKKPVEIVELIQKVVQDAQFEGATTQREVRLEHCNPVILTVDPVLIRAAIENVVRNALRYSPPGSVIQISTQLQPDEFNIIIQDQGPGVPEESLQKLFEPFARVAKARDRKSGGFGLGLAITGRSMLAHGGQVLAQNRDEGGLRVILKFPYL